MEEAMELGNPSNGTGGLLIVYGNSINNLGIIESTGSGTGDRGGCSGGGSVNLFYSSEINKGNILYHGGTSTSGGGFGGSGTATIGNISTGTFIKDEE